MEHIEAQIEYALSWLQFLSDFKDCPKRLTSGLWKHGYTNVDAVKSGLECGSISPARVGGMENYKTLAKITGADV